MALVNQTKYSLGISWGGSGSDVKNRTISGFNAATQLSDDNADMTFIGGFGRSLCQRLTLFSVLGASITSVSKEMPWQNDG